MTERDPRWEKVRAMVGQQQYDIDTNTFNPPEDICEFYISVTYGEHYLWSRILAFKDEVRDANVPLYTIILDQMVEEIDKRLDEYDKEKEHGEPTTRS